MNKKRFSLILQIITALTAWFALAIQLYILIANTPGNGLTPLQAVGRFLFFFTVICNLLVAISLTCSLISLNSGIGRFFLNPSSIAAVALYIFIVGLVYNIILRNLWEPKGLQLLADELLHVAVPVLFILYWLLFTPKGALKWIHPFQWLIFPVAYLVYAMTRGAIEGFYPYPFINLKELTYGRVILNCLGLMIVFFVVGLLIVTLDKWIGRKTKLLL